MFEIFVRILKRKMTACLQHSISQVAGLFTSSVHELFALHYTLGSRHVCTPGEPCI